MKRFLAAVVTVLFTYTSLVTPWVEASFWDERRKAVAGARSADGENAVGPMAGLPSSLMDAMPGAKPALADVVTRVPEEALGNSVPAAQRADFKRLPQSLKSLPMNLGEIRQVFLAKNFENRPIVVHIQDVHGYTDAQLNIAGMVEHLADAAGDKKLVVGVEGAAGAFRTGTFRAFPDKQTMKDVAGFLLDQNMIAAPEYAAWTSKTEPVLWGVENPALYLANGHAYKDSIASEKELKSSLTDMRAAIEKKEDAAFSPALRQLDIKQASYQAGKLPLGDYLKAISATGSIKRFPNLSLFMDALSREGKLDFAQVERERSLLIRRLADALSKPEIDALIETSLAYRSGKVSYGAYYNHLSGLCESKGVALSKYPAMKDYIAYVLSAERIEKEAVFTELNGLEKSAFQPLLKTSEEKELHALGADLTLAQKASDFAMTPDEWAEMEKRLDQINALPQRLAVIARSDGPSAGATSFDFAAALKPAETFCRTALARNDALVGNLLSQVKMNEHSLVVLIAGGFHTEGLVDRFKKQNVSVVVVTPQIKEIKEGNHYLDFLREKTPLEKLFTADVITYAKAAKISAATSLGDDATAALNAAVCLAAALALRRAGNFPSETQNALREMAGGLPVTARVNNVLGDAEAVVTMIGNVVKEKGVLNTGYTASPDAKSLARDLGPSLEAQFGPYHAIFGPVQRAGNDNMLDHLNSVLGQKARSIWAYFYHASGAQDMYEHQGAAIVRALTRFKGAYGVSEHGFGRTYLTQDGSVATLKPWERLLAATAGPFVVLLFSGALIFSFGLLGGTPWGVISALVLSPYWMLGFGNLFSSSVEGARGYEIREALRQWWTSARLTPAGAFRSNLGQNGPGSPRNGSFVWGPTKISSDSRDFLGRKASLTPMEWFGNIPEDVRASHVESVVAEMAKNSRDNSFMTFNLICFLAELRKISNEPIIEQTWNSLTKGDRAFNADKFIDDLTVAVFSERADLPAYASAMLDAGSVEALGWDMAGRLSDLVNKLIERANTPERRSKVLSFLGQVRLTALNDKGIPYQTSRDFQTLALAAMTVIHSIENGVNGAGAWRVTTVEAAMLTSEEHGKSFLDKRFLVEDVRGVQTVGPFAMENEDHIPGFYFRGIEDTKIKYGGDGREILYYMFHGLNRDPQKPADRSKFHITVGLLPGRGTGAGHQQGPWQDLKYGAGGNGVQLCVVPSDDGSKPARVTAQVFGKGTYAQADPMTQESILALGELSVAPEDVRLRRDPDGGYTMVDTNGRNVLPKPVDAGVGLVFFDFSTNLAGKDVLSGYAKAPLTNGLEKAPFSVVIDRDKSIRLVPQGAPLPVFQAPAAKNADLGVAKGADGIRSLCANADSRPLAEKLAERAAMNTIMHRPTALKSETVKMTWGEENWHGSTQKDKGKDKEKGTGEASLLMPDGREMLLSNFINMNPHVLGRWTRLLFGDNLPIFTKFLTTNFPPFVHLGFKRPVSSEEFMDWITTERNLMRDLHGMLSGQLDGTLADEFLKAYSEWAMKQSLNPEEDGGRWRNAKWDGEFLRKWKERGVFKTGARMGSLQLLFEKIRENRASYCDAVNLVPLEGEMGNTFVSFAGLAHAIAGLSEQVHPRDNVTTKIQGLFAAFAELERQSAPDQAFIEVIRNSGLADLRKKNLKPPKNEGWIVTMIGGKLTLVEPQQMSNETLSYMDFTTPFKFAGGGQGFIFRKGSPTTGLEDRQLAEYAKEMSLDPMSPSDVRYKPVPVSAGANSKDAKLFKLTDDPEKWPFYTSYSLELGANGEFQGVPPKETYQKIVLLEGEVELHHPSLDEPILLSPDHPCAIIWATVQGPYTLRSRGGSPARVMFEGVPTWNRTTPAGLPVATLANVLHALHSSKVEDAFDMLEQIRLGGGMNAVIPVLTAVFKEKHKGNSGDFDSLMTKLFPTDMDLIPWAVHPAFYEVLAQEYGSISASSRLPSLTDVVERAKSDLELTYFQLSTLELFLRTAAGWAKDTGSDRADEYAGLAETIANEMSRSLKSFDEDRARRVINEENGVMDNLAVIKDKDRPPAVAALLRELQNLWLDGILETKGKVEDFLARLEINFPAMTPIVQAQRTIFDAVKKGEVNAGLRSVTADPDKMTEPDSYESKYTVPALAAAAGAESRQLHSLVGIKALWAKILFYPSKVVYEGIGFVVAKLFGVKNVKVNFWEGTLESPQFESNASWGRARYLRDLVISVSSPAISVLLAWALSSLPNMLHIAVKTAPGFESTMFWLKIAIVAVNLILTFPLLFQGLNIIPIGRVVQGKGGEVFAASRGFRALKDLMGVINPKRGLHLKSTMFSLMPKPTRLPGGSERTLKRMLGIGALLAVSLQALPAMAGGFNYVSAAGPWGGIILAFVGGASLFFGGLALRSRAAEAKSWKGKLAGWALILAGLSLAGVVLFSLGMNVLPPILQQINRYVPQTLLSMAAVVLGATLVSGRGTAVPGETVPGTGKLPEGFDPARLATVRYDIVKGGKTYTVKSYADRNKISEPQARAELDWLAANERETDNIGLYGVDKCSNPDTGLVEYQRTQIGLKWGSRGSYDMRGPVERFWTWKRVFYIGKLMGLISHTFGVDLGFNITASHNPGNENGLKWAIRRRRGPVPVALVGGSVRESTPWMKDALMEGLKAAGVKVFDQGITTTPGACEAMAFFKEQGVEVAQGEQQTDEAMFDQLFGGNQRIQKFRADEERTPLFDLEGNNFMRPLNWREVQSIFEMLPNETSPENLERLHDLWQGQATHERRPAQALDGTVVDEPFRGPEDLRVIQHLPKVVTANPMVQRYNSWSAAATRLGPDLQEAIFTKWCQMEDKFPELVERIHDLNDGKHFGLTWPEKEDPVFWAEFVRTFFGEGTPEARKFAKQPFTAVRAPFKGKKIGVDFGNGSGYRVANMLEELGFTVIPVCKAVVTARGLESKLKIGDLRNPIVQTVAVNLMDKDASKDAQGEALKLSAKEKKPVVLKDANGNALVVEYVDTGRPDSRFPVHMPDPTKPEFQREAMQMAMEEQCMVVVTDEDVDRITFIDTKGRAVDGAREALMLGLYLDGAMIIDVRYPDYVKKGMEKTRILNETIFRGPVGYAFYIEEMIRTQTALNELKKATKAVLEALAAGRPSAAATKRGKAVSISLEDLKGENNDERALFAL